MVWKFRRETSQINKIRCIVSDKNRLASHHGREHAIPSEFGIGNLEKVFLQNDQVC